jgi:MFS family permease
MQTENIKKEIPTYLRWVVLFFISAAMFGNYYIYDCIGPLADVLVKQLEFSDSDIGLLQGIYSFPNIIMVLLGGIIIDRIGTRKSSLIFAVLIVIGAFLTVIQGNITSMAMGRLFFGIGAESMIVAVTTVIAQWFKGKQLAFAFGLNLTIARLGSFLAINSPTWAKSAYLHWQNPLWIAAGAGIICLITILIYFFINRFAQKRYILEEAINTDKVLINEVFSLTRHRLYAALTLTLFAFLIINFLLHTKLSILLQFFIYILITVLSFLNYRTFNISYWFIVALCITFYSAMFPFQTFAVKFFQHSHGVTREYAAFLSSILTVSAMIFTPLFGLLSDYLGKRSILMMFGSILIIPVYLMMGYTNINLIIPMAIMGISFSLIPAVMWPSVALVTSPSKLGTAYGLMTMIQNIGLFGFNMLIGWANDYSHADASNPSGYNLGMWIFSSLGFFGFIFAVFLRFSDRKNEYRLDKK